MIQQTLIRVVPAQTSAEAERFWSGACELHPTWDHLTLRDPIDSALFPLTSPYWHLAQNGAQFAGLVRLEAIYTAGGFYLDSDLELFGPLDDLCEHRAVGCWEDSETVPDLFMAAEAGHPAIAACIDLAIERISGPEGHWRTGNGAWSTGPGVTTTILPDRDDVTLLDPCAFTGVHWSYKGPHIDNDEMRRRCPDARGRHWWRASWLDERQQPKQYPSS